MDAPVDLYELLQVHPKADPQIIQKAYHTLMQRHHPDQGGSEEQAKRIVAAYEVLIDPDRRLAYDRLRLTALKQRIARPRPTENSAISCQQLAPDGILVADERGHRIVMLSVAGDIKVEIGGSSGHGLRVKSPRFAAFAGGPNVLLVDHERVVELDSDLHTVWQAPDPLKEPVHAERTHEGTTLITDLAARTVYEYDAEGELIWTIANLQSPQSATRLDNGNTLIADTDRLIEMSPQGKVAWSIPAIGLRALWQRGDRPFRSAVFAQRLANGHTLVTDVDAVLEVTRQGQVAWRFDQLKEVELRRAYRLDNGQTLIDYAHLVKKGINQEILLLDAQNRTVWRHYYSQHRFL